MTTFAASVTIVDLPVVTGAELLESRIGRASSKSGDVRYAAESRQVTALQRNDAKGQFRTHAVQQKPAFRGLAAGLGQCSEERRRATGANFCKVPAANADKLAGKRR